MELLDKFNIKTNNEVSLMKPMFFEIDDPNNPKNFKIPHANLIFKSGVNHSCSKRDSFRLHSFVDCLKCENCSYAVDFGDRIITSKNFDNYSKYDGTEEKYILYFFEGVPKDEYLIEYLTLDQSDYRAVRYQDKEIMRYSKNDKDFKNVKVSLKSFIKRIKTKPKIK